MGNHHPSGTHSGYLNTPQLPWTDQPPWADCTKTQKAVGVYLTEYIQLVSFSNLVDTEQDNAFLLNKISFLAWNIHRVLMDTEPQCKTEEHPMWWETLRTFLMTSHKEISAYIQAIDRSLYKPALLTFHGSHRFFGFPYRVIFDQDGIHQIKHVYACVPFCTRPWFLQLPIGEK